MENVDILCINCENMISPDKLSAHSKICISPTPQILNLSLISDKKQLNFKLDKLKCSIESILYDRSILISENEKKIFGKLSKILSEVLLLSDPISQNLEKCFELCNKIESIPQELISNCIVVYKERVNLMIRLKTEALRKEIKALEAEMSLKGKIDYRAVELEGLNKQLLTYKQIAGDLDLKNEYLDVDEGRSKYSVSSSITSPREVKSPELDELDQLMAEHEIKNKQRSNEDLQKYFYSKCLVIKLGFSSRDPVQFIQIPELYKKVREIGIPVEMWEEYINEQFKRPSLWIRK